MAIYFNDNGDDNDEMHDINVTPFIDVMLVLLIIFMVAAPLSTVDVRVNLPASTSTPQPRPQKPVYLSVKENGQLFVGNTQVSQQDLAPVLAKETAGNKETTIYFRADKRVDYGMLMKTMDALRGAGYLKIALVGVESAGGG